MMHNAVKHIHTDDLADKVGGRYALTVLVAKRLRQLNSGAPLLVDKRYDERLIDAVCREIAEGKVWLEKPEMTGGESPAGVDDISELFDME